MFNKSPEGKAPVASRCAQARAASEPALQESGCSLLDQHVSVLLRKRHICCASWSSATISSVSSILYMLLPSLSAKTSYTELFYFSGFFIVLQILFRLIAALTFILRGAKSC